MLDWEDMGYALNLGTLDPVGIGAALGELAADALRRPDELTRSWLELSTGQMRAGLRVLSGYLGEPAATEPAADRRFADRAWRENPLLRGILESYELWAEWARTLAERSQLTGAQRRKAQFGVGLLIDALAPSNMPWLNPAVIKEAIDTGGLSVMKGMANMWTDVATNNGRPRQVDASGFELGRNLAATPGRVIYRNELMELIAYEPQTDQVYAEPIVCSPPWINKYYVMDLAPGRSFIEYAVRNEFQVFAISYRNPDASVAGLSMDDYLEKGLLTALDVASRVSGSPRVNVVGLCLGGTLTAIALGYLAATGQPERVGWAAVTNTLVDFGEPGDLGVFTDEASIQRLEKEMAERGYLEASQMAGTFDWLRGNDLVWNYVVSNWYMGKQPPAFDILAWNADSTNMPATMHSQYLRACYLRNELVQPGAFKALGVPLDLGIVSTPMYVLAAENDHIAPWRSAYRTTQLVGGDVTFTLTSAGHIAGMVNPVDNPKSSHWARAGCPPSPEEWRTGAEQCRGSWWAHWLAWASARSGEKVAPPALPMGEPAPGQYVRNRLAPPMDASR
ncbi:MAG TPA: alpha/beta fold hydrolase [Chloroflexota bacterium]|nr:alpha/beta fold hydrolase [Chloroflexota bacterium]